jgi:hypothetical protein
VRTAVLRHHRDQHVAGPSWCGCCAAARDERRRP